MNIDRIMTIICVVAFLALWPFVKWLAIIALAGALIFAVLTFLGSRSVKQEIQKDPEAWFRAQENKDDKDSH